MALNAVLFWEAGRVSYRPTAYFQVKFNYCDNASDAVKKNAATNNSNDYKILMETENHGIDMKFNIFSLELRWDPGGSYYL